MRTSTFNRCFNLAEPNYVLVSEASNSSQLSSCVLIELVIGYGLRLMLQVFLRIVRYMFLLESWYVRIYMAGRIARGWKGVHSSGEARQNG